MNYWQPEHPSLSCSVFINPLRPSDAYMRSWTGSSLVQIMACRLNGAKPLSAQCWNIVNWTLGNKLQWNFNRKSNIFIEENTFENVVCEMASILSRPQCVNTLNPEENGHHYTNIFSSIFLNENYCILIVIFWFGFRWRQIRNSWMILCFPTITLAWGADGRKPHLQKDYEILEATESHWWVHDGELT